MAQVTDISHSLRIDDGEFTYFINKQNLSFEFVGNSITIYDNGQTNKVYSYNIVVLGFTSLEQAVEWFFQALRNTDRATSENQIITNGLLANINDNQSSTNNTYTNRIDASHDRQLLIGTNERRKQAIIQNNTTQALYIMFDSITPISASALYVEARERIVFDKYYGPIYIQTLSGESLGGYASVVEFY